MTGGTYFSGGEGVGVAMRAAGIEHKFGVEYDNAIADVARANGFDVLTADVRTIDPAALPYVDLFHASPVCKNASNAKSDGKESPEDIETAQAVSRYIEHHKPRVFTLENVWGYRTFEAFAGILKTLSDCGYKWDYWHLNSADYGVPQTRKRLILIASLDFQPTKPRETHTDKPLPMFETLAPWIGWYEAIEDLIPTLPPSAFAQWQLDRLPEEIANVLIGGGNRSKSFLEFAKENRPDTPGKRFEAEPSQLVSATASSDMRAFIMAGGDEWAPPIDGENRIFTITESKARHPSRAFLSDSLNYSSSRPNRFEDEPAQTVVVHSSKHPPPRAFIMPNENSSSSVVREAGEPSPTVGATARVGNVSRAWLDSGRVAKMTPRALARFQSVPDSYILPSKTSLACTVIGNMVPPKLYEAVIRLTLLLLLLCACAPSPRVKVYVERNVLTIERKHRTCWLVHTGMGDRVIRECKPRIVTKE